MGEGLKKPLFSQRCLQTDVLYKFFFLEPLRARSRPLADVFQKNEKKKYIYIYNNVCVQPICLYVNFTTSHPQPDAR